MPPLNPAIPGYREWVIALLRRSTFPAGSNVVMENVGTLADTLMKEWCLDEWFEQWEEPPEYLNIRYCGAFNNQHGDICLIGTPDPSLTATASTVVQANADDPNVRFFVVYTNGDDNPWSVLG